MSRNFKNRNNYGYPSSSYQDYSDDDFDSIFYKWMFGMIIGIILLLASLSYFNKEVITFFTILGNNDDFNRYFWTFIVMYLIVFFSKSSWSSREPYFGGRKYLILGTFLMIGYGAISGLMEIIPEYNILNTQDYLDDVEVIALRNYYWDIVKFSLVLYAIITTSWIVLTVTFKNTILEGTIEIVKHIAQVLFFTLVFVVIFNELRDDWMTISGTNLLISISLLLISSIIIIVEILGTINSWDTNNEAIMRIAIQAYKDKVLTLADQAIQDKKKNYNAPEHHKNYGTNFNTVIETKDITDDENMVFEIDGSKENVLLRIPEGLRVLISINKVPESKIQEEEKTKAVLDIVGGNDAK